MAESPIAHVLHVAELRDLADGKSFARGSDYHRQGRVGPLVRDGRSVKATVRGSVPYEVKLWAAGDRIAYACSCPIGAEGSFCKHCVAVALTVLDEARPAAPAPSKAPTPAPATPARVTVVTAPEPLPDAAHPTVFLAGSIDLGTAPPWQREVIEGLVDLAELTVFNPRRADWDASWEATLAEPRFCEQVEWELDAMERADVIAMYFAPTSRGPVTLLELGLHAASGKLIVCCPEGFWRKGNVDAVCRRHGVHQTHDLRTLVRAVRARVSAYRHG